MKKIIVGMSGGVDSAVAAYLLKKDGYDVEGIFMKNWNEDDDCPAEEDFKDALMVAETIGIPLHSVNFAKDYWDNVFKTFLDEYSIGRTPNPDILCNKEIKFKAFLDYCLDLGADQIATGHYAKIVQSSHGFELHKGDDENKDQSYFLYTLGQNALSKSLFPLASLTKNQIRHIAKDQKLPVYNKKDSTGICFIGERDFKSFLSTYLPANPGSIVKVDGTIIGKHDGLMYYTLGQRQGLGIGGGHGEKNAPWYVSDKSMDTNELIVVQGKNHPDLFHTSLTASQLHWVSGKTPESLNNWSAKIRYRSPDASCQVEHLSMDRVQVTFNQPQFAIAPGQSIVFYNKTQCLGGGVIDTRSRETFE
ncbi:MAG: tRNA 2-thiouridine(34) synthase MnmA [Candidatus Marinimicrobia bacterium]|nr:tRNA 2-thiouridine(34) synthase MnmA [Candidatus Neomarinimicrobiota bacterium]